MRQECRTDLLKLSAVLGFKDVCQEIHGPIVRKLQHFPGGEDVEIDDCVFRYRPFVPHWKLEGPRQLLILDPRGFLKTTVISIAHSVQWILNYPNIRICISAAIGDQIELVVGGLLKQFRYNTRLRALFPEFCPPADKAANWGNQGDFVIPARTDFTLKEPTVWSTSIGKVNAGFRADVTKHADLVNEQNVKTPGGIAEVISHFGHFKPIVERYNAVDACIECATERRHPPDTELSDLPPLAPCSSCGSEMKRMPASSGWTDVEGTRYDFGDLYGILLESPEWGKNASVRSAIKEDHSALWPERMPLTELDKIRAEVGDWIFSAQYLNKCIPQGEGLCDPKDVAFIPLEVIHSLLPTLRVRATVDVAGMDASKSGDDTAITVGGFDRDGRPYILEIHAQRFAPEEVIFLIFDIYKRYPNLIDFKIERNVYSQVLLPFLQREMSKRNVYPTITPIQRDSNISKKARIRGLRPFLRSGNLRFSQGIPLHVRQKLLNQIARFPSESMGVHDDILDTLADLMQDPEARLGVTYDVVADPPTDVTSQFGRERPRDRFLGFGEGGVEEWLYGPMPR